MPCLMTQPQTFRSQSRPDFCSVLLSIRPEKSEKSAARRYGEYQVAFPVRTKCRPIRFDRNRMSGTALTPRELLDGFSFVENTHRVALLDFCNTSVSLNTLTNVNERSTSDQVATQLDPFGLNPVILVNLTSTYGKNQ